MNDVVETPEVHFRPKFMPMPSKHHKDLQSVTYEAVVSGPPLPAFLRGFLIALFGPAPDHADLTKLHKVSGGTFEYVQCRVLLYHSDDFVEFEERVSRTQGMEERETERHTSYGKLIAFANKTWV